MNKQVINDHQTTLLQYDQALAGWKQVAILPYRAAGSQLEIAIPRRLLGLKGGQGQFDFKWTDHPAGLDNVISLCTAGDTAPNRRFNYRCIWKK